MRKAERTYTKSGSARNAPSPLAKSRDGCSFSLGLCRSLKNTSTARSSQRDSARDNKALPRSRARMPRERCATGWSNESRSREHEQHRDRARRNRHWRYPQRVRARSADPTAAAINTSNIRQVHQVAQTCRRAAVSSRYWSAGIRDTIIPITKQTRSEPGQ